LYILYTRMDTLLKLPLGVSDGKPKKISSKIFLTKVLFLETKASELSNRTYQIDRRYFHFVGKPC